MPVRVFHVFRSPADDRLATQKALQTVALGQQAENLLDFDDEPAAHGPPTGLAATQVFQQTPAAASLLAGTSSNPLDDLVSIFGSAGIGGAPPPPTQGQANGAHMNAFGGLGMMGLAELGSPPPISPTAAPAQNSIVSPVSTHNPQEDLLGLF